MGPSNFSVLVPHWAAQPVPPTPLWLQRILVPLKPLSTLVYKNFRSTRTSARCYRFANGILMMTFAYGFQTTTCHDTSVDAENFREFNESLNFEKFT